MNLVIASSNTGKLREFGALLAPLGWQALPQSQFGIAAAAEPHPTFVENALAKARHASRLAKLPALADDSGICAPLLGGAPGVHSARYAGEHGDDLANNAKLAADLQARARDDDDWRVFYVALLVFVREPNDPLPIIAEARWQGRFVAEARGNGGFGYDAHFLLPDLDLTAAQLSSDEKHRLSHRGQAARQLVQAMRRAALDLGGA